MLLKKVSFTMFLLSVFVLWSADWSTADCSILSTDALIRSGSQVTVARYPDAESVTLDNVLDIRYEQDGKWFQIHDCAVKLLTEKAVEGNSVVRSYVSARTARARIEKVQIIKPDGKIINIDVEKLATVTTDTSSMSANIYDSKDLIISVPVAGLETGDILRFVMVDELLKPRLAGFYGNIFVLEALNPVLRQSITIDAPASLPLKSFAIRNPAPGVTPGYHADENDNGRIIYKWQVNNVPQAFPEPAMPSFHTQAMSLLVSTFHDWREVSSWYHRLSNQRMNVTPEILKKVEELTADAEHEGQKIRSIFDFVSQQIRYMGVTAEAEAPGWEPHEISMTFEQRAGVCRDKAALLAAMLRAAGFDANPVLISSSARKDPEVPMPFFDHAITAIADPDGNWLLMDSTPTETRDLFPAYLAGKDYLVATAKGDGLRTSSLPQLDSAASFVRTWGTLHKDGSLEASTSIILNGIADNAYRGTLINTAEPEKFLKYLFSALLPGVSYQSLTISPANLRDTSQPVTIKINYTLPDVLAGRDKDTTLPMLLSIPSFARSVFAYSKFFSAATLEKRRFPYEIDYISAFTEDISIALPKEYGIATVPIPVKLEKDGFTFSREFFPSPGRVDISENYSTGKLRFSPEEYQQLKDFQAQIVTAGKRRIVLIHKQEEVTAEKSTDTAPAADAVIEDYNTNYILHSAHSWTHERTFRTRILSPKGLSELSELIYNYNPVWEDVELKYARVTNGEETVQVPAELIHHLDQAGNGAAPRYPGGKTLVVNFPAVQIGSVIEYCLVSRLRNRPFFSCNWALRLDYPILKSQLAIYTPHDMALEPNFMPNGPMYIESADADTVPKVVERKDKLADGRIKYTWSAVNIPRIPEESGIAYASLPCVIATTGDWKTYAAALQAVVNSLGDGGETVAAVARQFISLPPHERLVALRNWVELNIRLTSPAFCDLPLSSLSRPELTLKDGYGNSADMAILYHALLRSSGFADTALYLAGNTDKNTDLQHLTAAFPTPSAFPAWLVWVKHPETGEVWLNDQNRHAQFGTCSADRTLLLNLETGTLAAMKLEDKFAELNRESITYNIADDGSADIQCSTYYQGTAFGAFKRLYAEMQPEERRRHHQQLVNSYASGATRTGELITDFRRYPGIRSFRIQRKDFVIIDGPVCYFHIPSNFPAFMDNVYDTDRVTPLYLPGGIDCVKEYTYVLPPSFQKVITMPEDFFWTAPSGAGSVSVKCRLLPGSKPALRVTVELYSEESVLSPAEFKLLLEAYRKMSSPDRRCIILAR